MKIVALLAALAALWAFAAWVTVRDGLNLLFVNTLTTNVGVPTEELVDALQEERRLSAAMAGGGGADQRSALESSRVHTDEVIDSWREGVTSGGLGLAAPGELEARIDELSGQLGGLAETRAQVDQSSLDRREAVDAYTELVDTGFLVYGSLSSLDDQEIAEQSRLLISLTQARELLSREDSLMSGALAAGEFTQADITELTRLIGAQQLLYERTAEQLSPDVLAVFETAAQSPEVEQLRQVERVLETAQPGAPPVSTAEWRDTVDPATTVIRDMELAAADLTVESATPVAIGVIVRLVLAAGLGLIAVVAAVIVSITTARALVRQLERLRDSARDLANNRLPRVVDRLSTGETVDVAAEAPPLRFGDDEIGQVGKAFNAVQETAIRASVQQAELRHGVRDVFLSLARRTQNLVHKQLSVVDSVERRQTDADEMEDLYRIDHLATRMRRNAENLIVLAGATPGRTWRHPVPMVDVVRGAIGEVEDYQRVNLMPVQAGGLEGRVVGDVIHLLAELIENAASYSPPYAKVSVGGQQVAHGFVIEIEDRGLGMPEADLVKVNQELAEPPDFSLADASRLGHYVVAKLAQRHGIRVHLRTSPYGGITAIVLIPNSIMAEIGERPADSLLVSGEPGPPGEPPAPPAPPELPSRAAQNWPSAGGQPVAVPSSPAELTGPVNTGDPTASGAATGSARVTVVRQRGGDAANPPGAAPDPHVPDPHVPDPHVPDPHASHSHASDVHARDPRAPDTHAPGTTAPTRPPEPNGASRLAGSPHPSPVRSPDPEPAGPPAEAAPRTPSGLPWRVRQASLPKQLIEEEGAAGEPATRDPEAVRRAMRSFQLGTQRGRTDAEDPRGPRQPGDHQEG